MDAQYRLFVGGWAGGIFVTDIPWWNGLGIIAVGAFMLAVMQVMWWWAARAEE